MQEVWKSMTSWKVSSGSSWKAITKRFIKETRTGDEKIYGKKDGRIDGSFECESLDAFSEHSVNIQCTFSAHSVNIQCTFSAHSVHIQVPLGSPRD